MDEMIELRPVRADDAVILRQELYPAMTLPDVQQMIAEWESGVFEGRPFEMFALTRDGRMAGTISLFGLSPSCASIGPEIFAGERRKGIASSAMRQMMKTAAERGYRIILQQIRTDNAASIRLHEKLGFETDGYVYRNKKDHDVVLYVKSL